MDGSAHQDLVSLVNALELSTFEYTDVTALRARVLSQLSSLISGGILTAPVFITSNPSLPSFQGGTLLQVSGLDGVGAQIVLDAYGNTAQMVFRNASGTASAPTATILGRDLARYRVIGRGTTDYSTGHTFMAASAAELWTDTAHGLSNQIRVIPKGSTSEVASLTFDSEGNIFPGNLALLTTATDGFVFMQACPGTPTGVPTQWLGAGRQVPFVYDTTNNIIYVYNGAWKATAALT